MSSAANNSATETSRRKFILSIIEGLLIAAICFGFGTFYWKLSNSTDIRWENQPSECLNPSDCDVRRVSIAIYKLGGESVKDVRLSFAVTDPGSYEVVGGSVERSSVGILNGILSGKEKALGSGATLSPKDPELNPSTSFDYTINEFEAGYRYDLTVILKSETKNFSDYANFQVVNKLDQPIGREGLTKTNYISLYFAEAIVLTVIFIVALAILIYGITWKGRKFFAPIKKIFHRKR